MSIKLKLHILKYPVIAVSFFLTACAVETGDDQTQTSEETELSSDVVMTTNTEFAETITSEKMSRIEELVRTAGYAVHMQCADKDLPGTRN